MNEEEIVAIEEEVEKKQDAALEEFITALPEWDLLPPYNVIRKGNTS